MNGKAKRAEVRPAKDKPRGNRYSGASYYPYWLKGKVRRVRRVYI